jgi:hypothetical protein
MDDDIANLFEKYGEEKESCVDSKSYYLYYMSICFYLEGGILMALMGKFNKKVDGVAEQLQESTDVFVEKVDDFVAPADSGSVLQGLLGNYAKQDVDQVHQKWSQYMVDNERVITAYKLVRDELIITNYRIMFIDKQGVTGQKKAMTQIYLDSIVDVSYTSAGFGFDDIDMFVTYMVTPFKKSDNPIFQTHHFEFPKKHDVTDLYRFLMQTAINNRVEINQYR